MLEELDSWQIDCSEDQGNPIWGAGGGGQNFQKLS